MTPQQTQSHPGSMSAADAEPQRRSAFQRLMAAATEALSGRVVITAPKPKPAGSQPTTPDLTARAVRTCNRNPEAVEAYLRLHQILVMTITREIVSKQLIKI